MVTDVSLDLGPALDQSQVKTGSTKASSALQDLGLRQNLKKQSGSFRNKKGMSLLERR